MAPGDYDNDDEDVGESSGQEMDVTTVKGKGKTTQVDC